MTRMLSNDLATIVARYGLPDPRVAGPGEFSTACPFCPGSKKHFRLFEPTANHAGMGWCRETGEIVWADTQRKLSDAERAERERIRSEHAIAEMQALRLKVEELQTKLYWERFHREMADAERELWRSAGIPDGIQDYLKLGYTTDRCYSYHEQLYHSPALTIPYYGYNWEQVFNVQYRLLNPIDPGDKYRLEKGLPKALYRPDPSVKLKGPLILLEGAKKGIVLWHEWVARLDNQEVVVAIPELTVNLRLLDELGECDPIYIAVDPDGYNANKYGVIPAKRIGQALDEARVRYVRFPFKIDDALVKGWMQPARIGHYLKYATRSL